MPVLRFRLKTLMIAMALLAACLGRWMNFRHIAYVHHQELGKILVSELELYFVYTQAQGEPADRHLQAYSAAQPLLDFVRYHWAMEEKYTDAFRHPWLWVPRDPPPPTPPSEEYQRAFRSEFFPGLPIGGLHGQSTFPHAPSVVVETQAL